MVFKVLASFDHRNIERSESVLKSRRASKKLINWIADTQELQANTVRIWIDGKNNVLADAGSRTVWENKVAQYSVLPEQSIRDTVKEMFTCPKELEAKTRKMAEGLPEWRPLEDEPYTFNMHCQPHFLGDMGIHVGRELYSNFYPFTGQKLILKKA